MKQKRKTQISNQNLKRTIYLLLCLLRSAVDSRIYGVPDPGLTRRQVIEKYIEYAKEVCKVSACFFSCEYLGENVCLLMTNVNSGFEKVTP
jgi:hypothetical protein